MESTEIRGKRERIKLKWSADCEKCALETQAVLINVFLINRLYNET